MPLIAGANLVARIRNTQKLLTTAAGIMSVFLIATSFVTTVLIPAHAFEDGGMQTDVPWPTWRISTSGACSALPTTSARF